MHNAQWKTRKVVIVGAGAVGSTFAYTLAQSGLADEIVLLDVNQELVKGQVLDTEQQRGIVNSGINSSGWRFFPPSQNFGVYDFFGR